MGQQCARTALPAALRALSADPAAVGFALSTCGAEAIAPPSGLSSLFVDFAPPGEPLDGLDPASYGTAVSLFELARRRGQASGVVEVITDPGQPYHLHLFDLSGSHSCLMGAIVPVSQEELLVRLTRALPMGILQVGAGGATLFSNPRWFEITGLPAASSFADLVALAEPATRTSLTDMLSRCSTEGTEAELQFTLETPAGHRRVCWLRLSALMTSAPRYSVLASLEDVTSTHRLHRRLVEAAERDPLTRLLNRSAIVERLERSLLRAAEDDLLVGVLFVDLDDFKSVNDRFGHATGDDVLQRVGDIITGCVRRDDLVGRLGGDEFVVIVPDLHDATAARLLAARIMAALGDVVVVPGEPLITGSVGVAAARARVTSANQLLEAADAAMYEVKRRRAAC